VSCASRTLDPRVQGTGWAEDRAARARTCSGSAGLGGGEGGPIVQDERGQAWPIRGCAVLPTVLHCHRILSSSPFRPLARRGRAMIEGAEPALLDEDRAAFPSHPALSWAAQWPERRTMSDREAVLWRI